MATAPGQRWLLYPRFSLPLTTGLPSAPREYSLRGVCVIITLIINTMSKEIFVPSTPTPEAAPKKRPQSRRSPKTAGDKPSSGEPFEAELERLGVTEGISKLEVPLAPKRPPKPDSAIERAKQGVAERLRREQIKEERASFGAGVYEKLEELAQMKPEDMTAEMRKIRGGLFLSGSKARGVADAERFFEGLKQIREKNPTRAKDIAEELLKYDFQAQPGLSETETIAEVTKLKEELKEKPISRRKEYLPPTEVRKSAPETPSPQERVVVKKEEVARQDETERTERMESVRSRISHKNLGTSKTLRLEAEIADLDSQTAQIQGNIEKLTRQLKPAESTGVFGRFKNWVAEVSGRVPESYRVTKKELEDEQAKLQRKENQRFVKRGELQMLRHLDAGGTVELNEEDLEVVDENPPKELKNFEEMIRNNPSEAATLVPNAARVWEHLKDKMLAERKSGKGWSDQDIWQTATDIILYFAMYKKAIQMERLDLAEKYEAEAMKRAKLAKAEKDPEVLGLALEEIPEKTEATKTAVKPSGPRVITAGKVARKVLERQVDSARRSRRFFT